MGMSIFSELEDGVVAAGPDDMHRLAGRLASVFPADGTLALQGDLGAGKTTFVKGLAAGLGGCPSCHQPRASRSCNLHRGDRLLVHVDAYRLSCPADWDGLLIGRIPRKPLVPVVEWPERLGDRLPPDALWLGIEIQPDLSRMVRVIKATAASAPTPDLPAFRVAPDGNPAELRRNAPLNRHLTERWTRPPDGRRSTCAGRERVSRCRAPGRSTFRTPRKQLGGFRLCPALCRPAERFGLASFRSGSAGADGGVSSLLTGESGAGGLGRRGRRG